MYEAILRGASGNASFAFEVETVPMPTLYVMTDRNSAINAGYFVFISSIGLSLLPTVMMSFILREREEQQKHM